MDTSKQKFICSICHDSFTEKGNLTRHSRNVHSVATTDSKKKTSGQFSCTMCDATYMSKGNLTRHINEKHCPTHDEAKLISCPTCNEPFTRPYNLIRHVESKHKDKGGTCMQCNQEFPDLKTLCNHNQAHHKSGNNNHQQVMKNYHCELCDQSFTQKQNLNQHMENIHEIKCKRPPSVLCPLCDRDAAFQTIVILEKHLVENHNVTLKEEDLEFDSVEDFNIWKKHIEKEDHVFFCLKVTTGNRTYYDCHRSGCAKTVTASTKFKWKKSLKIGKNCPARIVATTIDGRIKVHFQRTHVGHTQTIKFLRLSKEERDELAGKPKIGVPADRILDDIRKSVVSSQIVRISNKSGFIQSVTEEDTTSTFELLCDQVVQSAKGKSTHIRDSVCPFTRLKTLFSIGLGIMDNAEEKTVLKVLPRLESIVEELRQNQMDKEAPLNSTPHFSELPKNLPSLQNVQKRRSTSSFHSTRKNNSI